MLRVISFELPCAYFKHLNDHPRFSKNSFTRLHVAPPPGAASPREGSRRGAGDGARWMERSGSAAASVERADRSRANPADQRGLGRSPGPGADSSPRTLLPPSHVVCASFFFFFSKRFVPLSRFPLCVKMHFHLGSFFFFSPFYFMKTWTAGKLERWLAR